LRWLGKSEQYVGIIYDNITEYYRYDGIVTDIILWDSWIDQIPIYQGIMFGWDNSPNPNILIPDIFYMRMHSGSSGNFRQLWKITMFNLW
jgi:hypothetical protein